MAPNCDLTLVLVTSVLYEVTIQTTDKPLASSNNVFFYAFIGTKGRTPEHKADQDGDRRSGQEDTWTFTDDADIGEFRCIGIRMKGNDNWGFRKVLYVCL